MHKDDLLDQWLSVCRDVTFAFQPIVSIHNGRTYGFEALLRKSDDVGYSSISALFHQAAEDNLMVEVNAFLLQRAIALFSVVVPAGAEGLRLFFNLDNRVFRPDPSGCHDTSGLSSAGERIGQVIAASTFPPELITLEISEQWELPEQAYDSTQLPALRSSGVQIALDDFGAGYSGLQVLYQARADIIKIDRFFITGIHQDSTKRIFITNLVHMAHAMGQRVVAEGVETEEEFYACREIGCDYIQGYLVCYPETDSSRLHPEYPVVETLVERDRRSSATSEQLLNRYLTFIPPVTVNTSNMDILKRFRSDPDTSYVPVVNEQNEPLGIIREQELKEYVYSPYGISLLMNQTYRTMFYNYLQRVPTASVHSRIDRILELYALDPQAEAVIITDEGRYRGCLQSRALIQLLHERQLATARDQNPLTRLPGNTIINEYITAVFKPAVMWHILVYLDFNYFKPFNDTYGFRVGDRVIQLFADLLRQEQNERHAFVGHIGGDDFFLAYEVQDTSLDHTGLKKWIDRVGTLMTRFSQDVLGFYTVEDVERGYIESHDRDGKPRNFSLLDVGAAILFIPPHTEPLPFRELSGDIASLKSSAKRSSNNMAVASAFPVIPSSAPPGPVW